MQKNAGVVAVDKNKKMEIKNTFRKIKENHSLMMILCCVIPLIIAGILYYFGFKTYALIAVMLLCPILHYFMMNNMHGKHGGKDD